MPSRFGLRQILTLAILLVCSVLIAIALVQNNRRMAQPSSGQSATAPKVTSATTPHSGESWARPGIAITELYRAPDWASEKARPLAGGRLVEALESAPQTLTPFFATDAQARRVIQEIVCQTLARFGTSASVLRASLATAFQSDPQGKWLRVKIDDRARFSDGTPVTAEDVTFSLDVLRTPGLDAHRTSSAVEGIESIEIISDRVVEFHFKEPRALNVMHALCSLYIVPKHYYERFTAAQLNASTGLLMGSGPFMLQSVDPEAQWTPGSDIVLVRDPHAWEALAHLDSIRFTVITDAAARLTALRNGDIHIMRPSPDQATAIDQDQSARSWAFLHTDYRIGSSYSAIAWNCADRGDAPSLVSDRRVRTALTHLVDRDRIVMEFYGGSAATASDPFPKTSEMGDFRNTPLPFDPARAAALLDDAGWITRNAEGVRTDANGRALDIDLAIPQGSRLAEFVSLMLKDQAAKAGIRIRITTADMAAIAAMQRSGNFDGAIVGWSHGLPENEPRQQWHSSSADNSCRFSNPDADRIIELGERTVDFDARMRLWHQLHRVLHDEQPCTFLVNPFWMRLISPKLGGTSIDMFGFNYSDFAFRDPNRDTGR